MTRTIVAPATSAGVTGASGAPSDEPKVLGFDQISSSDLPRVGGKGANLGEMTRAGLPVPPGFCITTNAFDTFLTGCSSLQELYARLDALDSGDPAAARDLAGVTRAALESAPIPPAVAEAAVSALRRFGEDVAWAVRSSATAEDLPDASFAGQQDTYLNVRGEEAVLQAVRRCWASLFTERAVLYRARNGYGHRGVKLSVVVQRMVSPDVSGILFTADPVGGRRGTALIEAGFGLGEALVGGLINADLYRIDKATGDILEARVGDKAFAIRPRPEGGTSQEPLPEQTRRSRSLDDARLRELCALGARIERHYGKPQDIEWCIEKAALYVVQTRPITSLYPLPEPAPEDGGLHAYVSFGHVQMMTDPMPPLALQLWRLLIPVARPRSHTRDGAAESDCVTIAGSRLFLDMTPLLRRRIPRRGVIALLTRVYPEVGQGLKVLARRISFGRRGRASARVIATFLVPVAVRLMARLLFRDPARLRTDADHFIDAWVSDVRARLRAAPTGPPRLRESMRIMASVFRDAFLDVASGVPVGLLAQALLHRLVKSGVVHATPEDLTALERGLPGNVTTEMDLAVGDLIDQARAHPSLLQLLRTHPAREALAEAPNVDGGAAFLEAWRRFLDLYGMRGPGEVDLSRPRYEDDPAPLISTILGSSDLGRAPGEHRARHMALAAEAEAATARIVAATRSGFAGRLRAAFVRRLVRVARAGLALREHPKFLLVRVMALVRQAVRDSGEMLQQRGSLDTADDVYLFRVEELLAALESASPPDLRQLARERRARLQRDAQRSPPLVVSSDGEIPALAARDDLPAGALAGTAASAGVVEGLARVVRDPGGEVLHDGEILVAPHTDPGWTPLFVHAAGLVTEVGGLITHGSVVAREYGIPAVVSVANATHRIRTGQRIRVDGTRGFVQVLSTDDPPRG